MPILLLSVAPDVNMISRLSAPIKSATCCTFKRTITDNVVNIVTLFATNLEQVITEVPDHDKTTVLTHQ